jgi:hypothetical protein
VFRLAPRPSDALPAEVRDALARSFDAEFTAADLHAARRVLADAPGWLVPATGDQVCLVDLVAPTVASLGGSPAPPPAIAHDCTSEATALGGGLVESQSRTAGAYARSARVVGVVPDGVSEVTVHERGRPPLIVDVIRNAYDVVVPDPVAVSFALHRGSRSVVHTVPVAVVQAPGPPRR